MRKSECAEQMFKMACNGMKAISSNDGTNDKVAYMAHCHAYQMIGLRDLAASMRDVYDKLEVIDRKLSRR